jgi:hypothetical protein
VAARSNSKQNRTLRERCDADLRLLLQERCLPSLKHVILDHHSYVCDVKQTYDRAYWEAVLVREPRDIYNDDTGRNGWEFCEHSADTAQTLIRSSVNIEDIGGP